MKKVIEVPELVLKFSKAHDGFEGYLVIDSTLFGPASGGLRILEDISEEEIRIIARSKTLKNVISGIPAGGAKAGIKLSPHSDEKHEILEKFAYAIKPLIQTFNVNLSPEMGSNEDEVLHIYRCLNATELLKGSILLNRIDGVSLSHFITAYGVVESVTQTIALMPEMLKASSPNKTVAIEGFGRVGSRIASYLSDRGYKIIAVSNKHYMISHSEGLDIKKLVQLRREYGDICLELYLENTKNLNLAKPSEIFSINADILIPSSRPHIINGENVDEVNSKLIVPCANNPIDDISDNILFEKRIMVLPDFVSNSGGVISGMAHRLGFKNSEIKRIVKDIIRMNLFNVLYRMKRENISPRHTALKITQERMMRAAKCNLFVYKYFLDYWLPFISNATAIRSLFWLTKKRVRAKFEI